jgi:hypothetical protein
MPNILPKEFEFSHDFAFFLHDILAHIVVQGEKEKIFNVEFEFSSKKDAKKFEKLNMSGEALWNWLDKNNYRWVTEQLAAKQCLVALLSDFCQYIYESLVCSKKGKLSVAYSLLRKPFKDNLFYLEWLFADPIEFHDSFNLSNPDDFSISSLPKEKKIHIISNAITSSKHKEWLSPEFIYDLRYNKNVPYGFESLWNKATHLVTNFKSFKTEPGNFNFIFSDNESKLSQWDHYYRLVPLILFYAVEVINVLLFNLMEKQYENSIDEVRRLVGFFLWTYETTAEAESKNILNHARNTVKVVDLTCPLCKKKVSLCQNNLKTFFYNLGMTCRVCKTEIYINPEKRKK